MIPRPRDVSRSRRPAALARTTARVLLVLGLAACGGEAQEVEEGLVVSSDPELRRLAAELLPDLASRAGLELVAPVRLERRTRAELDAYLRAKLDEEFPVDEAELTVEAYSMLGLVPEDLDLRGLLLELYTEQVAGFYEPDSTALFVMDDQPREVLEGLLLHELVHAVQDQTVDLAAITDADLGNDRAIAAQAAIEGHATLVMLEYMAERMTGRPIDLSEVPALASQLLPALDAMEAQFPALAAAPLVIRRSLLFPYVEGSAFVQSLWAAEGRVAPFGSHLPTSTEHILHGELSDRPVALTISVVEGRILDDDVLGRLEMEVLLRTHLGAPGAPLAEGWGGDRYALVEAPSGPDRVLVWATVWDDEAARDRFIGGFTEALSELAGPAALEAGTIDGHPSAVLTIGEAGGLGVTVRAASAS
jgi:hypothetical protein